MRCCNAGRHCATEGDEPESAILGRALSTRRSRPQATSGSATSCTCTTDTNDDGFADLYEGDSDNDYVDASGSEVGVVILGGEGDDYLVGSDVADGLGIAFISNADDLIVGGDGNDEIVGGEGLDFLVGGEGDDTFYYSLSVDGSGDGPVKAIRDYTSPVAVEFSAGPQSYSEYLGALGLTASTLSQSDFSTSYTTWLNYLVYGDGDAWLGLVEDFGWEGSTIEIGLNQNDYFGTQPQITVNGELADLDAVFGEAQHFSWTKGKATQERTYWDVDPAYGGDDANVSSTDGHDVIYDFVSGDQLFFSLNLGRVRDGTATETYTEQDLIDLFDVTLLDSDDDGVADSTVLTLDPEMSITLYGYADFNWETDVTFYLGIGGGGGVAA